MRNPHVEGGIVHAHVVLWSNIVPARVIAEEVGLPASSLRDDDDSPRKVWPSSRKRYAVTYTSDSASLILGDHVDAVAHVLRRVAELQPWEGVEVSFVIMGIARGTGYIFEWGPDQTALLAAARSSVWLDVYTPDQATDSEG
jgi:hypothetical protein